MVDGYAIFVSNEHIKRNEQKNTSFELQRKHEID